MEPLDGAVLDLWQDRLAGDSLYHSTAWLAAMQHRSGGDGHVVLSVDEAGIVHAGAACTILPAPKSGYGRFDPARLAVRALAGEPPPDATAAYPSLACTVVNAYASPIRGDLTPAAAGALLEGVGALAERAACRTVAVLYVEAAQRAALGEIARRRGYAEAVVGGRAYLPLPEGPAAGAPLSADRRRRLRHEARTFAGAGLSVRAADPRTFDAHLAGLQIDQYRLYGFHGDLDHVLDSHRRTLALLGDSLRLGVVVDPDGLRLGFLTYFVYRGACYPRHFGLDQRRLPRTCFPYPNLAFHGLLDLLATETAVRRVEYGPGSYEVKVRHGCRVEPLYGYLRTDDDRLVRGWRLLGERLSGELRPYAAEAASA